MKNLKDVSFKRYYFPPSDNVVRDFFIPTLKQSISYKRATGFFTSYSLVELSVGVCDLASRHGKIRIITSPRLSKEDVKAIEKGYDEYEVISDSMTKTFEPLNDDNSLDRLALLAELVATGVVEFKVAVMKNLKDYPDSMFHPKFGIMTDESGNSVAFSGSMNESRNGLGGNWDQICISTSWSSSAEDISELSGKFDNLWDDNDSSVRVINLPGKVADLISSYKKDSSMLDLDKKLLQLYDAQESVFFKKPVSFNIRDYQKQAISEWVKCNYSGIYNMATGTGKTKTCLCSLEKLYNDKKDQGIITIIVCPQKHLVDQWADNVREFSVNPIIGYSDVSLGNWKEKFRRLVVLSRNKKVNACLITTIASFSTEEIQQWLAKIDNLAIVIDEAHNMGSAKRLTKLPGNAKYRLALSATVDRYKDPVGTHNLREYFGQECISFSLEKAIGRYLTNYHYHPIICQYNEAEYQEFVSNNESLDAILNSSASAIKKKKAKHQYALKSYTLNARIESKFDNLSAIMKSRLGEDHILIYCGKTRTNERGDYDSDSQLENIRIIDKTIRILGEKGLGINVSRFTYTETPHERRNILKEFENGNTETLVAISCLDEGVDIPSIKTAILITSSDNPREYIQRRGRVLRQYPGKKYAEIYDFVAIPANLDYNNSNSIHSGIELRLLSKEIKRIIEFKRVSSNSKESDALLLKISQSYHMNIPDIVRIYGE